MDLLATLSVALFRHLPCVSVRYASSFRAVCSIAQYCRPLQSCRALQVRYRVGVIIEQGLRDRKKAATRAALSGAAARLARALGIECVTADAIASEAGVSTRTFHNYFSSKEEAVLASFEESVNLWIEALASRPADEPILDVLEELVVEIVNDSGPSGSEKASIWLLSDSSPALYRDAADMHQRINRAVVQALAERTGTDAEKDLYPTLLLGAVGGAAKSVIDVWTGGKSEASSPEELVHDAFRQIRAGLPAPPPAPEMSRP